MKDLNVSGCEELTGKAQLIKMSEGLKGEIPLKIMFIR